MIRKNTDNRLRNDNKIKAQNYFNKMYDLVDSGEFYHSEPNDLELSETKTAVILTHLPSGARFKRDVKSEVINDLIETTPEETLIFLKTELLAEIHEYEARKEFDKEEKVLELISNLADKIKNAEGVLKQMQSIDYFLLDNCLLDVSDFLKNTVTYDLDYEDLESSLSRDDLEYISDLVVVLVKEFKVYLIATTNLNEDIQKEFYNSFINQLNKYPTKTSDLSLGTSTSTDDSNVRINVIIKFKIKYSPSPIKIELSNTYDLLEFSKNTSKTDFNIAVSNYLDAYLK